MPTVHTIIEINAPIERVWEDLTDLSGYAQWNPSIREAKGHIAEGAQLEFHLQSDEGNEAAVHPTVSVVRPERELRWRRQVGGGWLFESEHTFRLEPTDRGTRLVNWETYSGLLAVPLGLRGQDDTRRDLEAVNRALKLRAEQPRGAGSIRAKRSGARLMGIVRLKGAPGSA